MDKQNQSSIHSDNVQNSTTKEEKPEEDEIVQTDEIDKRSIFVKNVEYTSTKDEIIDHFKACGKINRVTIIFDKYTQHPKGCCYIEFADQESAENSMSLTSSIFKGRQITIMPKRTNIPHRGRGIRRGRRPSYYRGGYSRGGFYRGRGSMFRGYVPRMPNYHPYKNQ